MDWLVTLRRELETATIFLTRLPLRAVELLPLAAAGRAFPLVGALVGGIGAVVFVLAAWLGLPAVVAALLAVTATIAATGALHEDGLADSADGLFSGAARERALEIMRDSRIGTFGALALILSVGLRVSALSHVTDAAAALVAVHAVSRGWLPCLMHRDAPARANGLAAGAGRPDRATALWAAGLGIAVAGLALGLQAGAMVAAVSALCALGVGALARRRLGGYTGDTLGAAQQAAETGALLLLTVSP